MKINPDIIKKFQDYPPQVRVMISDIRNLIFEVAQEFELGEVEESVKWNAPSYVVKGGSPVRLDWCSKTPGQIWVYFICTTKLVETFREIYTHHFEFAGNRAILLDLNTPLPTDELKHCVSLAFRYQRLKNKPLLGA